MHRVLINKYRSIGPLHKYKNKGSRFSLIIKKRYIILFQIRTFYIKFINILCINFYIYACLVLCYYDYLSNCQITKSSRLKKVAIAIQTVLLITTREEQERSIHESLLLLVLLIGNFYFEVCNKIQNFIFSLLSKTSKLIYRLISKIINKGT
jgi:hypothetical protein